MDKWGEGGRGRCALEEFGQLDILVNNAGMGDLAAIEDTSLEDWNRTIGIDQTGVFLGMKTAAAALAASGHGSVINISSIFGTSGGFGTSPAYHAAKGAVRTLTKNVALHWADRSVRVNSVHPGFIDTPILDQAKGTPIEQAMLDVTPMGRLGTPAVCAAAQPPRSPGKRNCRLPGLSAVRAPFTLPPALGNRCPAPHTEVVPGPGIRARVWLANPGSVGAGCRQMNTDLWPCRGPRRSGRQAEKEAM